MFSPTKTIQPHPCTLVHRQRLDKLHDGHAAELKQLQHACEEQVAWQLKQHEARVLELQQQHSNQLEQVKVAVGIAVSGFPLLSRF